MRIVVDTSILIDHLRNVPEAVEALLAASDSRDELFASVLTKVEVLAGMRSDEERATRALFEALVWIDVNDGLAEDAGILANRYRPTHPGVDPVDYVIAATALRLDAALWTRNVRHFPMFAELRSPY